MATPPALSEVSFQGVPFNTLGIMERLFEARMGIVGIDIPNKRDFLRLDANAAQLNDPLRSLANLASKGYAVESGLKTLREVGTEESSQSAAVFERSYTELRGKIDQHEATKKILKEQYQELLLKQDTSITAMVESIKEAKNPKTQSQSAHILKELAERAERLKILKSKIEIAIKSEGPLKDELEKIYQSVYKAIPVAKRTHLAPPLALERSLPRKP